MAYFAALRGVFDFDASYDAYCAMAACDADKLVAMTTTLRKRLGVKPSQVKFHKAEKSAKSFKSAKEIYNAEYQRWLDAGNGRPAKTYLVKVTGTQAKKPGSNSNLTAHYSHKRPKKIATPFGGEADNREVF